MPMNALAQIKRSDFGLHYYLCQADKHQLQPIVMVHGWGADSQIWQQLPQRLSQLADVITLDLPGCGQSAPITDYSIASLLRWMQQALPSCCTLVGLSLGGMLCHQYATRFPDKVNSLITISSNQQFVADGQYADAMPLTDFTAFVDSWQADPAMCLKRFAGLQAQGDQHQRELMRQLRKLDCTIDHQSGAALLDLLGTLQSQSAQVTVPLLTIFGERDALIPASAAANLGASTIIPQAGHLPHLSAPDAVFEHIEHFLELQRYRLDKSAVAVSFGRAARSYDQSATLQHRIGEHLLHRIDCRPEQIMDLGCGTGYHSIQLQQRYPQAQVVGVDLSAGMLSYAQTKYSNEGICWLCADAESLPVQSRSQSLVFSNFALQWCDQLDRLAAEIYRVLEPKGQLLLAVPGPRTLIELRQAWADIDKAVHVNRFASLDSWQGALAKAGFSQIDLETTAVTEQHQSVRQLLLELKNVGAHNNNAGRAGHLTGKQRLQALYHAYEQYRLPNGQLPATWEIIVGTVRK